MNTSEKNTAQPTSIKSLKILATRIFWMLLGPAVLFAILFGNTMEDKSWFSGADLAFFILLGLVVLARWVEQRSGQCTLADGQASTWKDFRRYVGVVVPVALAIWAASNVIGNYLI
jgi:hypothetical protein